MSEANPSPDLFNSGLYSSYWISAGPFRR